MKNMQRLLWTGFLAVNVGFWLAGCTICPKNKSKGIAIITCQPMDVETNADQPAVFKVKAKGKDLVYQWYFHSTNCESLPVDSGTTSGGQTNELTVLHVSSDPSNLGFYWCRIESSDYWGAPIRTRTREATLGISPPAPPIPP